MAPSAITPSTNGHGHNGAASIKVVAGLKPNGTINKSNGTANGDSASKRNGASNGTGAPHISSTDVITMEHEYGAHK